MRALWRNGRLKFVLLVHIPKGRDPSLAFGYCLHEAESSSNGLNSCMWILSRSDPHGDKLLAAPTIMENDQMNAQMILNSLN